MGVGAWQRPWLTEVSSFEGLSEKSWGASGANLAPQKVQSQNPAWKHPRPPFASWQPYPDIRWPCPVRVWLPVWAGVAFNPREVAGVVETGL